MFWTNLKQNRNLIFTILFLWFGHFCVDLMIGIWAVYKTMAHLDLAAAGLVSTVCAFTGEGMQLVFGSLSDKGHRKQLIALGILATTAATLLAYTDNYYVIFFFFFLTCLGSGAFHPAAASWIGSLSQNRKGLFITIFTCGGTLGIALSQIIFYHSFYYFHGHTIFLAIPLVVLVIYFTLSKLRPVEQIKNSSQEKFSFRIFLNFLRRKDLSLLYISQVCNQTVVWGLIFLLPDVLISRKYESWICFGGAHLSFVMGSFIMQPIGGYLADKYSCRRVILSASAIGMVLFYLFLYNPLLANSSLMFLLFFLGAALGLVNPVSLSWGAKLVPDNPGIISALLMGMVWCVSEGLGQGGGGLLSKLFIEDAPAKALGIIGSTFIIGFSVILRMPKETPVKPTLEQI